MFRDMSGIRFLIVDEADRIVEEGHFPEVSVLRVGHGMVAGWGGVYLWCAGLVVVCGVVYWVWVCIVCAWCGVVLYFTELCAVLYRSALCRILYCCERDLLLSESVSVLSFVVFFFSDFSDNFSFPVIIYCFRDFHSFTKCLAGSEITKN
jgi:hypothetical protein